MVYPRAKYVSIPERYIASKSFATVREAIKNVYPNKEVKNNTEIHRTTEFRDTGSVCL
jgi:hypothetical protein